MYEYLIEYYCNEAKKSLERGFKLLKDLIDVLVEENNNNEGHKNEKNQKVEQKSN